VANTKPLDKKKLVIALCIIAIMLASTTAAYIVILPHNITETLDASTNQTKFVEDTFQNVPIQCYVVYAAPKMAGNSDLNVQIYNDTKNYLLDKFGDKIYQFLELPAAKLYLFNHCGFFDNSNKQIPNKYDPTLGVINSTNQSIQLEKMRDAMQIQYDFKTEAGKQTKIDDLATFYFISYDQVVQKLISLGLISQENNCHQVAHAHKGVLQCIWKDSVFAYYNQTGSIMELPSNYGSKTNSTLPQVPTMPTQ
jgi:hypothetical protein